MAKGGTGTGGSGAGKNRGVTGQKNALAHPFRMNGRPPDWTARQVGAHRVSPNHATTAMVRGAIGGLLAMNLGFPFEPSPRFASLVDESLERAPSASAVFDRL